MNKITRSKDLMVPKVTTGPISASSKVYSSPEGHADVRVPFREIALTRGRGRAVLPRLRPVRPLHRRARHHRRGEGPAAHPRGWVKERGGVEDYVGRDIKPEDNGNVSGKHLARDFPNKPRAPARPRRASPSRSYEFARAGIITKEMIYVAHRENLGRKAALARAKAARRRTAKASAPRSPSTSRRSSCATRSPAAAPSSRPTSTTPNWSR